MLTSEALLALQSIDTESDQLTLRRERLPERADVATHSEQLAGWERRRSALRARIDELTEAMDDAEQRSARLRADRDRLQTQLKRVIAPREAEALMHEIATVERSLEAVDAQELADLTEVTDVEEQLSSHLRDEGALRDALRRADEALASAVADLDAELADLAERRDELRAQIDSTVLPRYDRVRSQLGVAVARLDGHRCDGCHIDLSAAEVDIAKEEAAGSRITDCPQCGRMLVV